MFDFSSYLSQTACVTSDGKTWQYKELLLLSEKLSAKVRPHSLIFILCSNTIGSLVGYVSFLQANCVSLLLNRETEHNLLDNLITTYSPAYIWVPDEMVNDYPNNWSFCYSICGYSLLKYQGETVQMPEHLALLLTTSGSTGSPKLVRLSKVNLMSNAKSIAQYLCIDREERAITSLPMYYSYGLSVLNSHLISGATILLTDYSYIQREFWNFVAEQRGTSFAGVPFTYEVLKKMKFWNKELSSLRTLTQAGGRLSNDLIEYFATNARQRNMRFYVMYGQTEATARMSYLLCNYAIEKLGSIGMAIPGGNFELIDECEALIEEPDTVGELVYKGENVCLGYAECLSDLMRGDDNKGILHTGDLAYRDIDGFYYIAGRKKRFLKLFGNRISLDYTENLLKRMGCECVCVGTDNKMIVYVTEHGKDENIISFLINTTKLNRVAFEVRYIEYIPRSEAGKIMYSELPVI